MPTTATDDPAPGTQLAEHFSRIRSATVALAAGLSPDDCQVQSMPDASPTKWHLAHTSWFYETFLLVPGLPAYERFRPGFDFLFNSYYHAVGAMHARAARGLITRPTLAEVREYRAWVDRHMVDLLSGSPSPDQRALTVLGLQHEQQHQELLLTDILHAFSLNPLQPAYADGADDVVAVPAPAGFVDFPAGLALVGHEGVDFAFDNERPRHRVWLEAFAIADRPVTNAEFRAFVDDGGYRRPELWLSDGWATVQAHGWRRPLYWSDDLESEFSLVGRRPLVPDAFVRHLSHYEADAYARWAGARLPTEFEWEAAMDAGSVDWAGEVWEWTSSAYLPYPGFRPASGNVGEYNGKFMSGQMVLRGGSCFSAAGHVRTTYRNFFPPDARWQCAGLRLARDA